MTYNSIVHFHKYERWPSDKANHTCESMLYYILYVIQGIKYSNYNFLASADIKVFDCTYLFTMLLLIDLALFYTLGIFV